MISITVKRSEISKPNGKPICLEKEGQKPAYFTAVRGKGWQLVYYPDRKRVILEADEDGLIYEE